jgi:hypothetical protein
LWGARNAAAAAGTLHPRRNASGKAARVLLISLKLKVETMSKPSDFCYI